ncbi:complex I assembly factor ACAD9, mitochondrial-like [Liolophura sinensis]|uniref:complex I assembly factor ACAD9, mitochondrial-like n=1 Tax=Liolophura sinensis TaxID=3198878 RepID=UPI003158577C
MFRNFPRTIRNQFVVAVYRQQGRFSFAQCKRFESSQVAPKTDESSVANSGQTAKAVSKELKEHTPFTRNLFLGKFDESMLVFPEISEVEDVQHLNEMIAPIERFFSEALDSQAIDVNAKIPEETLQQIKDLGLFGQQIPEEYGGLGLNATQFARIAEVTALDGSVAVTLAAHQSIGLKGILIFGTEAQKEKYLPKLATGEHVAAFCLTEPSSGSDAASIQTRATLSEDGKTFYLNGGKIWISNGGIADIMTVFAKTEITNEEGEKQDKVTAFVVERAFGGVSSGKPEDKLGIRGSNTCEVYFDNTPVPLENVLGEVGGGFKVAMKILNSGRFSMGSSGAGIVKKLINMTCDHAITRKQFGKSLCEFQIIQEKFARMAVKAYVMESMSYLTAGVLDSNPNADMSLEAAMVKIYSSEAVWESVNESLQILGGLGYMKSYPFERYLRDSRILLIFEGTNEILRMLVALSGLQHAGKELKELVKKLRNPLNNPNLVFKTLVNNIRQSNMEPSLTLKLNLYVHPSLQNEADILERNTLRLQKAVEHVLKKYGNKIVDEQLDAKRLAEVTIDLYSMTACIGRASRSYCIGLKNADHEMMITRTVCHEANQRIEQQLKQIYAGSTENMDDNYKAIANMIFKNHGYAAEHPLTRNW